MIMQWNSYILYYPSYMISQKSGAFILPGDESENTIWKETAGNADSRCGFTF